MLTGKNASAAIICALLLVITNSFVDAQIRKDGFVVRHEGDTIAGSIIYSEGNSAYKVCNFKPKNGGESVEYSPKDIAGYGFKDDKFYVSRYVNENGKPSELAFIEMIVQGYVNFYRYQKFLFIEKGDTTLQQLVNTQKAYESEGVSYLKDGNQFIGKLNSLMFDCAEVRNDIQKARFNEEPITKIVEKYNRCHDKNTKTFKASKPWAHVSIGLIAGITTSTLNVRNAPIEAGYVNGNFDQLIYPSFGLTFDINSPRVNERFSLHADFQFSSAHYERYARAQHQFFKANVTQLKIPFGFKFILPLKNISPYIVAGPSFTWHLTSEYIGKYGDGASDVDRLLGMETVQIGLWGGVGASTKVLKKHSAALEIRYERTNGILDAGPEGTGTELLNSKVTNIQAVVSFSF
jgi:opacity protein-like surface antigen